MPELMLDGIPAWWALPVLCALAGLLALDETAIAQTWFGQPLAAGVLTGYLVGDPVTGLAIALPLQIGLAGNLPVGQTFTGDHTSAVVAVVGGARLAGVSATPALEGTGDGSAALLGWLILAAGLISLSSHWLVQAERRANGVWMQEGRHSLRDGSLGRMTRLHKRGVAATFVRGAAVGLLGLLAITMLWIPAFDRLPVAFHGSLAMLPLLLPGLGIGTMIDRYGLRNSWLPAVVGAAAAFLAVRHGW
jgi:mannose/fructose/N-acetylgalactosamine-specific phosphotransferase system component IIC